VEGGKPRGSILVSSVDLLALVRKSPKRLDLESKNKNDASSHFADSWSNPVRRGRRFYPGEILGFSSTMAVNSAADIPRNRTK